MKNIPVLAALLLWGLTGCMATHTTAPPRVLMAVATRQVVAQSSDALGTGTGGIQVNPVNGQLYLTAYSGQVSVLDPASLKLLRQFPAADTPDGIFFSRPR